MCGKPKKSDYKASKAEQMESKVAGQKAEFFNKNYQPLNVAELKDALSEDITNIARGRANAETMQGLTSNMSYQGTQNAGNLGSDLARSYQSELGGATAGAEKLQNMRLSGAVGTAQGQQADSSRAMSALTNIGTSEVLNKAKNNELLRAARFSAGMKVAGAGFDKKFGAKRDKDGKPTGEPTAWDGFRDAVRAYS
jgi:hypothetical protein|tara:strand:- start:11789 stop:12376 length:588 start_codon:yes stop_codon:yes gene_type:complete